MSKIWAFIFRKIPIVKQLDGYKTYIGALFLFLAYASAFLGEALTQFPELSPYIVPLKLGFEALDKLLPHLDTLGWIVTPVGLVDKVVKSDKEPEIVINDKDVN